MEQRGISNKYKNFQYYESKYTSNKKQESGIELINEKKYDYLINRSPNNSKNKDNSNGSRNNENINNKYNMKNNIRNYFSNNLDIKNNENANYNNGGNIDIFQNNNINYKYRATSGNNIIKFINNSNNNNKCLENDPKKFSNVAKALKYIGNKDNSNINYVQENNYEMKRDYKININKNNNLKTENNSYQNNNVIKRSFDIQVNYNKKKINLVNSAPEYNKTHKIWSNINKDLVPTKADLKFEDNDQENKDKTPLKNKRRYYRNYNTENNNEVNNNKINGGENNVNQFINEEEKYDTEENNRNFISYKIRIKDLKEISKQKKEENSNMRKFKSNNNIKVTYDQGRRGNKNITDGNLTCKNQSSQNQDKNEKIHNLVNMKNRTNTRSSPNILLNENIKNMKSPKLIKENSSNNILNPNNGKISNKNYEEINFLSPVARNIPLYKNNSNITKDLKLEETPVRKIYIEKTTNKFKNTKNENELNNIRNNKINERIKELKQIMNYNNKLTSRNDDNSNNENGLNIDNKIIQENKIIFHKKVSKSPIRFNKKANITNYNMESKENIINILN